MSTTEDLDQMDDAASKAFGDTGSTADGSASGSQETDASEATEETAGTEDTGSSENGDQTDISTSESGTTEETDGQTYTFEGVTLPEEFPTETTGQLKEDVTAFARAHALSPEQANALLEAQAKQVVAWESQTRQSLDDTIKAEREQGVNETKNAFGDKLREATQQVDILLSKFASGDLRTHFPNAEALYASPQGFKLLANIAKAMGEKGPVSLEGQPAGSREQSLDDLAKQHFGDRVGG